MKEKKFDLNERLRFFIKEIFNNNATVYAKQLGIKPQALHNYLKDKNPIGTNFKERLEMKGGINPKWLEYGDGSMFAENDTGIIFQEEYLKNKKVIELSQRVYKTEKNDFEIKQNNLIKDRQEKYSSFNPESKENVSEVSTSPVVKIPKINEMNLEQLLEYKKRIEEDYPFLRELFENPDFIIDIRNKTKKDWETIHEDK